MGNKKITELSLNSFPSLNDVFPIVNNGITKKLNLSGLTSFISPFLNVTGNTSGFDVFVTGGTYSSGTITFKNNTGGTFTVTGLATGGTGSVYEPIVTVTTTELTNLIDTNSLEAGKFYKVTNVDIGLYGGTDIYLQALSTNQISVDGYGLFYNPKYILDAKGHGIWTKYMYSYFQNYTGTFDNNEQVTSENGAIAYYIVDGFLLWESGIFSGTTTITGNNNNAVVTIENTFSPNYNTGDTVIWGGYVWQNLTGLVGNSNDNHNLDNNWELIPYNTTDYNLVLDQIKYDYVHDKIIARKDRFGNEVVCNYISIIQLTENYGNPIKDFQWGGKDNYGNGGKYYFNDEGNNDIDDGGNDMYDGGNELYTNLDRIPYTHTQMTGIGDEASLSDFKMDGQIQSGDTYFGLSSQYFTNLYPDLFVLAAHGININEFKTEGNLGADGGGLYTSFTYTITGYSTNYSVYIKQVYDAYEDPSVNHIMIVDTIDNSIVHDFSTDTDDDYDSISNLTGVTKVYYLLTALANGEIINQNDLYDIIIEFLNIVDNKNLSTVLADLNENYENITNILPPALNTNTRGVIGNKVYDSYFDCINFIGEYLWFNYLDDYSVINENIFAPDNISGFRDNLLKNNSLITYNRLVNSFISRNFLQNEGYIEENYLGGTYTNESRISDNYIAFDSGMYENKFINSYLDTTNINNQSFISNLKIFNSQIYRNELKNYSGFNQLNVNGTNLGYNNLNGSAYIQNTNFQNTNFQNNILTVATLDFLNIVGSEFVVNQFSNSGTLTNSNIYNSYFRYNEIKNYSNISYLNFTGGSLEFNNLINSQLTLTNTGGLNSKNIRYTNIQNVNTAVGLSAATILFSGVSKTITNRIDNTPIIMYVDNSNTMQIALLTD